MKLSILISIFALGLMLAVATDSKAQSIAGICIGVDVPNADLKDYNYKTGFNFSFASAYQIERFPRVPVYVLGSVGAHLQTTIRGSAEVLHRDGLYYEADTWATQNMLEFSIGGRFQPLHKSYRFQPFVDIYWGTYFLYSRQQYSYYPENQEESVSGGERLKRSWEMGLGKAIGLQYNGEETCFNIRFSHQRLSPGRMADFENFEFTSTKSAEYDIPLLRYEWIGIEFGLMFPL